MIIEKVTQAYLTPYMPWIKVAVVVLILFSSALFGYKLKGWLVLKEENQRLEQVIEEKDKAVKDLAALQLKYDGLSGQVITFLEKNDAVQEKVIERFYKEVQKPVYTDCLIPNSGILLHNEQVQTLNKQIKGEPK